MIATETLQQIARERQTSLFPNIVREYAQHLFLSELYQLPGSEKLLFKGGTALRVVYNSPRFSEDLDFSLFVAPYTKPQEFVENLFVGVLARMENNGISVEIGNKSSPTSGGYFGIATVHVPDYSPINIEINISTRGESELKAEVDSVANGFVPTYTIYHLSQKELVNEKIFGALLERKKPRDYYDLYFIMRHNMLSAEQKQKLGAYANQIIQEAKQINFQGELGAFLPASQQAIVRDFAQTLEREMSNQLSLR
jgi:predicted nucleotidyltransferase component of viral defense system